MRTRQRCRLTAARGLDPAQHLANSDLATAAANGITIVTASNNKPFLDRELPRSLLKFSGGSVEDYATCSSSFMFSASC